MRSFFGLQVHGGKSCNVRWRNLNIRELPMTDKGTSSTKTSPNDTIASSTASDKATWTNHYKRK